MVSPSTSTSAGKAPVAVTTVPPRIRVRMMISGTVLVGAGWRGAGSGLRKLAVGVRPTVPVELPLLPDLFQQVHVQVADQHLVGVVRGGAAHDLAARVGEVGLTVEVVVAERFDADPVDRADEVLVG